MKKTINQRKLSQLTGALIILMTIVAGMCMGMVYAPLLGMDTNQLSEYLSGSKMPFIFSIIGWITILVCDLFVSWGLYKFYEGKDKTKSKIMGLLRLVYSLILMFAIIQLFRAVFVWDVVEQMHYFLHSFQSIWQFGLIIFGAHLLYLAILVSEKKKIRQAISILLFIAGIGYILSNTADLFIADYESMRSKVEAIFILPMVLGEFGLAVWLTIKGGKEIGFMKKQYVSESC